MSVETFGDAVRVGGEAVAVLKKEMDRALKEWGGVVGGASGIDVGGQKKMVVDRDDDEDDAMDL